MRSISQKTMIGWTEGVKLKSVSLVKANFFDEHTFKKDCVKNRSVDRPVDIKFRSIDGTCNNLNKPWVGSSLTTFKRLMPAQYENKQYTPIGELSQYQSGASN